MRLIQLHMLGRLVGYAAIPAAAITVVILSMSTHGLSDLLARGTLSIGQFLTGLTMLLPMVLTVVTPVATALAVVYAYSDWERHSELVALRSVGAGDGLIAVPGMAVSAMGMVFTAAMSLYLLPTSFRVFEDIRFRALNDLQLGSLHEGVNRVEPGLSLAFAAWSSRTGVRDVTILDSRKPALLVSIRAERGELMEAVAGSAPAIHLRSGDYLSQDERSVTVRARFDELEVPLRSWSPMTREWRGFFEEHIGDLLRAAATANEADRLLRVAEGHRRVVAPLLALGYGVLSCAVLLKTGFRRTGPTARSFALGTAIIGWHGAMALGHGLIGRIPQLVPIYYALAVLPALAGFSLLAGAGRRSATVGG